MVIHKGLEPVAYLEEPMIPYCSTTCSTVLLRFQDSLDVENQTVMKYPTTRFVFDRKKTATKDKDSLVQVEILFERKKKYVGTGVRVYKDQWHDKLHVVRRDDMLELNKRIDCIKAAIDEFIYSLIKTDTAFTWQRLETFLEHEAVKEETFIEYIEKRIWERTDISGPTKKSHTKILSSLTEFGKIVTFDHLTRANIVSYYEWLLGREINRIGPDGSLVRVRMSQATVWGYMKILRTYIHDAMVHERLDKDPSFGIKVKRGDYEQTRWLSEEEIHKLEDAKMPNGSLARVRDLFIFCCYSGLAFSDLIDFKPEKLEKDGKNSFIYGRRIKTGKEYVVLVLPKAQEILEKYEYNLPTYSNQQYNNRLKEVAKAAGIDKPLTSHWARISFGFLALNKGVRIEVVSKAMGHATIAETQRTYSRILKKTVVQEMSKLR